VSWYKPNHLDDELVIRHTSKNIRVLRELRQSFPLHVQPLPSERFSFDTLSWSWERVVFKKLGDVDTFTEELLKSLSNCIYTMHL
jgi:hypothetical protein